MTRAFLTLAAIAFLATPAFAKQRKTAHTGERVDWKDVPAPAQATIQSNLSGGQLLSVEKDNKKGVAFYRAEVSAPDGKFTKITVTDSGKLIKVKADNGDGQRKHKHKPLFGSSQFTVVRFC